MQYSQPEPAAADVYYPPQDPAARAPPSPAEEPQSYASKLTGLLGGMMSMVWTSNTIENVPRHLPKSPAFTKREEYFVLF